MGFEIFGILNHEGRVDSRCKRFVGKVATARRRQIGGAWKFKRGLYVCFLCIAVREVLTWLYWLYLVLTSLSMLDTSCKFVQHLSRAHRFFILLYLLESKNDVAQGFVCSVFDFVPMKGFQILFNRLFTPMSAAG